MTEPVSTPERATRSLLVIREQFAEAVAARKCHGCGCLSATAEAIAGTEPGARLLEKEIAAARAVYAPKKYDCLGCAVCHPAIAANAFVEAFPDEGAGLDLCPTEAPEARSGWPPLPGDFRVIRYGAPVAVCTLHSSSLVDPIVRASPDALSIIGTMHTENLGIERVVQNLLANPHVRFLIVCGEDTQQLVGHLPGQSLVSLAQHGLDDRGRIVGARGKRPILKNVSAEDVRAFRRQVDVVDLVGTIDVAKILAAIDETARRDPGPAQAHLPAAIVASVHASDPVRLVRDPAGFFVVYPDRMRARLSVEHYTNAGLLDVIVSGATPASIYAELIERRLITRLDHAAYLGRELARAEHALGTGEPYVQDRAAGREEDEPRGVECGCEAGRGVTK